MDRRSPSSRRGASRARASRRFPLWPEFLESRITPTGNLAITSVSVVSPTDQALSVINVGEKVDIKVNYTSQNLPSNASYRSAFEVNGLTLDSTYGSLGAGDSSGNWYIYWGSFIATPGTNQVTVNLDPDQSVAETTYTDNIANITFNAISPSTGTLSYTAAQIRSAYGISDIPNLASGPADGTGQTIAIVDAGNDPTIVSDLDDFDQAMSLGEQASPTYYQQYGPASSILNVYNQSGVNITANIADSGSNGVPPVVSSDWELEITIDVEWAHAIAPGAKIDLIETNGGTGTALRTNLFDGISVATSLPAVSVVSNSWDWTEFSGETAYDTSTLVTPAGHTGITFLASSGDNGEYGEYPSYSPNVVAVGGTQLTLDNNTYSSETGWSFPTPRTLNNGSSSYSQTGSWSSESGGFSGTYGTAPGGSTSSATWTTTIASTDQGWLGGTEVSTTWTPSPSNATKATYTIYDGTQANGTVLGTVVVDQTKAPSGTADGSSQFQELGDYYPTSGTLTVVLNAKSANGNVVADAVGIAPGWASSGGQSKYEPEPSYQLPYQSTGSRTDPDVSFDGSDSSGVTCFQNGDLGYDYFGTSVACPCWAGLIAIVNQGRVANGDTTLNSPTNPTQTLQALYSLPASDYNDITTGYNGYHAGTGYDTITGLGTPIANLVVPDLISYGTTDQLVISTQPPSVVTAGSGFSLTVTVEAPSGKTVTGYNGSVTIALANDPGTGTLGGTLTATAVNGVASFSGLTLDTAGTGYTIQATSGNLITGTTNPITVVSAAAASFVISPLVSTGVTPGIPFSVQVVAFDSFGNTATTYTGTIHFSSSDARFKAPADYTFVTTDQGSHVFQITLLTPGNQTLTVTDDANSSITATASVVVNQPTATVTKLTVAPAGALYGQAVTLKAIVTPDDLTGAVIFFDGTTELIALPLTASGTTFILSNLPVGTDSITASYSGSADGTLGPSVSAAVPIVVSRDTTSAALSASATSTNLGQSVTLTAAITALAPGSGIPTGKVTFYDGTSAIGQATLGNTGHASLVVPRFALGTHLISVAYPGDPNNLASQSTQVQVYVGDVTNLDFDGDGKADLAVFGKDPFTGLYRFKIQTSSSNYQSTVVYSNFGYGFGNAQSIPVPADYFGDGKDAYALWTPNSQGGMTFTAVSSVNYKSVTVNFGGIHDIPVIADIDGDGKADFGVYGYQPGYGYRFDFLLSTDNFNVNDQYIFNNNGYGFGNAQSIPVVGDFDGSGKAGFGLYTPSSTGSTFTYVSPSANVSFTKTIGTVNDVPEVIDYDGDGKADLALYGPDPAHPGQYRYLVLTSSSGDNPTKAVYFDNNGYGYGNQTSVPVVADYQGEGKADFALYVPDSTGGHEYVYQTSQVGAGVIVDFAAATDLPLTASPYWLAKKVRGY